MSSLKIPEAKKMSHVEAILKSTTRYLREETETEPFEFEEEFSESVEYGIGAWFRWIDTKRVPWEHIFTLTSNKGEIRTNA
jgi:hypothetical protein